MSYSAAIDSIIAAVQAIEPTWDSDIPFRCFEDASGYVVPVDEVVDDSPRIFDIRLRSLPADDGGSGYVYTRFRVGLDLRIRYPIADRGRVERMMAEDVPLVVNVLIHPDSWHASIQTIPPPEAPTLAVLSNADRVPVAFLVSIPFEMLYLAYD